MGLHISDDDIYIIHGFGDRDDNVIFLRVDEQKQFKWSKNRSVASEFTRIEAEEIVNDAVEKGRKVFAIRVV